MNAPALGRDVAPLGRSLGAAGFARGAPRTLPLPFARIFLVFKEYVFA